MPITLTGQPSDLKRPLLTSPLAEEIKQFLSERLQLRSEWKLKYSLEAHGSSLTTLYAKSNEDILHYHTHGYLLLIKDARNGLFGAFVNEPIRPSEGRFRGSEDCFLFKIVGEKSVIYPYTGQNDFVMFNTQDFISFGGGDGQYGLWVDDNLNTGVTYNCATFNNEPLSAQGSKFDIVAVEVWQI